MADAPQVVNIYEYITPQALDALYVLEGHKDGPSQPKSYKGKKDSTTTYYGMTDAGLNTIRSHSGPNNFNIALPEWMKKASAKSLTKEQAREAAGLLAAVHEMQMDAKFMEKDGHKYFHDMPLEWRSAVQVLAHSNGVNGWIQSYDEDNPGSIMKAMKTGSREVVARAMMSKGDGSLMEEPHISKKSGRVNRILSSVKLMYDTKANTFKDEKSKDEAFKRWTKNPHTVFNVQNHLNNIYQWDMSNRDTMDLRRRAANQQLAVPTTEDQKQLDNTTVQAPVAENKPQKEGIFYRLYKRGKNLFTNSNEVEQNVEQ